MQEYLARLLAPIRRRLDNLVARAVVSLVSDATTLQALQLAVLEEETREHCERFQQYGFTSVPLAGAEAVVLFVGGLRDHALVTNVDDRRYRKKNLAAGEVALYNHENVYVLLKLGQVIEANAPINLVNNGVYKVAGNQVVGPRGAAVSDPTGGSTVDTQARTAIAGMLARLRAHGLIES
jgi:phage baseplate assembly protein V